MVIFVSGCHKVGIKIYQTYACQDSSLQCIKWISLFKYLIIKQLLTNRKITFMIAGAFFPIVHSKIF